MSDNATSFTIDDYNALDDTQKKVVQKALIDGLSPNPEKTVRPPVPAGNITHYSEFILDEDADPNDEMDRLIIECDLYRVNDNTKPFFVSPGTSDGNLEPIADSVIRQHVNALFQDSTTQAGEKEKKFTNPFGRLLRAMPRLQRGTTSKKFTLQNGMNTIGQVYNMETAALKWLTPDKQYGRRPHPLFDMILKCLSGDNHNFRTHLEMCILQKRFFPNKRLPTIVWQDPGGTGKQLFVGRVLKTIFSGSVMRSEAQYVFGTRSNIGIMGKAVVWADEAKFTDTQFDTVLGTLDNDVIQCRGMGRDPVHVNNTAWYFISNNKEAPIFPSIKPGAARRFSYMRLKYDGLRAQTLDYYIERDGLSDNGMQYIADNLEVLNNPDEVAIWLGELLFRNGMPEKDGPIIEGFKGEEWVDDIIKNRGGMQGTLDLIMMTDEISRFRLKDLADFHNEVLEKEQASERKFASYIPEYLTRHRRVNQWHPYRDQTNNSCYSRRELIDRKYEDVEYGHRLPKYPIATTEKFVEKRMACEELAAELHQLLVKEWSNILKIKPRFYPEKNVWTDHEIMDLLASELGNDIVSLWSADEKEEQIELFLCRVRDARQEALENVWKDYNDTLDEDAIVSDRITGESITIYKNDELERVYQFTIRTTGDANNKPTLTARQWQDVHRNIEEWINRAPTDAVYERKMLKVYLVLMENTRMDTSDVSLLRWGGLQKIGRNNPDVKEWLRLYDLPQSGQFFVKMVVENGDNEKIVFGQENVVRDLYFWWGSQAEFWGEISHQDDDLVFCVNRNEPYDFRIIYNEFMREYGMA